MITAIEIHHTPINMVKCLMPYNIGHGVIFLLWIFACIPTLFGVDFDFQFDHSRNHFSFLLEKMNYDLGGKKKIAIFVFLYHKGTVNKYRVLNFALDKIMDKFLKLSLKYAGNCN